MNEPTVPGPLRALAAAIHAKGGRSYLVGGCVRDHLMDLPLKDWDIEVFGLPADDLQALLAARGKVNTVGRSFGVFKWQPQGSRGELDVDVSVPRRDSKIGPGHKGIAVEGDPDMTLFEATQRRDLTVNALMWDLQAGQLEDLHDGRTDIAAKRLRAVDHATFLEDPLRALRVVQFAARLGFSPDAQLVSLCKQAPLDELPAERVQGEWGKLLLKGRHISHGLAVARQTRVLDRVFPHVAKLKNDAALDRLVAGVRDGLEPEGRRWTVMVGAWLYGAAPDAISPTLDRLGLFTWLGYPVRDRICDLLGAIDAPIATDTDLRRLSTRAELLALLLVRAAVTDHTTDDARARAEALGIVIEKPAPLLLGRHLKGLQVVPGPQMGILLKKVYELQLDGTVGTEAEALAAAAALGAVDQ